MDKNISKIGKAYVGINESNPKSVEFGKKLTIALKNKGFSLNAFTDEIHAIQEYDAFLKIRYSFDYNDYPIVNVSVVVESDRYAVSEESSSESNLYIANVENVEVDNVVKQAMGIGEKTLKYTKKWFETIFDRMIKDAK